MSDFPYIEATLQGAIPDAIVAEWQKQAAEHEETGRYAAYTSFARLFPYEGNPLSCAVANTAPHAAVVEVGHAGFHLPSRIDWSAVLARAQARHPGRTITKPVLIVPFEHTTPATEGGGSNSSRARTAMTAPEYRLALRMAKGDAEAGKRLAAMSRWLSRPYGAMSVATNIAGAPVRTATAATLAMLTVRAQRELGQPGYTWQSHLLAGLTRKEQRNPAGKLVGSQWMTFRAMTPTSLGWFIPQFEGHHIAQRTAQAVQARVRELVAVAAEHDVAALVTARIHRSPA